MFNNLKKWVGICALVGILGGCAAAGVAISKRDLDVQTKMTNTIFLEPVGATEKTIFVQIRNTSDKPEFDIGGEIRSSLINKGYTIMSDPDQARYLLQANILQAGKSDPTAAEKSLAGGYGDVAVASLLGIGLGGQNSVNAGLAGGLLMGAGTLIANSLVKDVYYSVTTDLQISERVAEDQKVITTSEQKLAQGSGGSTTSVVESVTNRQRYQTRILSSANQVNLDWEDAAPVVKKGLVRSISGMF